MEVAQCGELVFKARKTWGARQDGVMTTADTDAVAESGSVTSRGGRR